MLKKGDIIAIEAGHKVYADVPEHFLYENRKGSHDIAHGAVVISGALLHLAGKYVVYRVTLDGGGSSYDGWFPNGHHVFCEKVDDHRVKIDFYQSGSFTAMIEEITPIGES